MRSDFDRIRPAIGQISLGLDEPSLVIREPELTVVRLSGEDYPLLQPAEAAFGLPWYRRLQSRHRAIQCAATLAGQRPGQTSLEGSWRARAIPPVMPRLWRALPSKVVRWRDWYHGRGAIAACRVRWDEIRFCACVMCHGPIASKHGTTTGPSDG